jgi:hypothetical protein
MASVLFLAIASSTVMLLCRAILFQLEDHWILDGIPFFNLMALTKRMNFVISHNPHTLNFPSYLRYAEMSKAVKNEISHRGKALQALKEFFQKPTGT